MMGKSYSIENFCNKLELMYQNMAKNDRTPLLDSIEVQVSIPYNLN